MQTQKRNILVTGGAGYIGSHTCKLLAQQGFNPVVYDNFSTGWQEAVRFGPFIKGDLLNTAQLIQVIRDNNIEAVVHFAAFSLVSESVEAPAKYWQNNVGGTLSLLEAMRETGIKKIVFSSTAAVYGEATDETLSEDCVLRPTNTYGATKSTIEQMLADYARAYDFSYVVFRYFNVAGADPEGEIGEQHEPETHIIPLLIKSVLDEARPFTIFGDDYQTVDGTCVRDYIHVWDIADAHVRALDFLDTGKSGTFNLGTNTGFTVKQLIDEVMAVTGGTIAYTVGPRRAGDPACLVSTNERARQVLGWEPKRSNLKDMITDAYRWHQSPGYTQ